MKAVGWFVLIQALIVIAGGGAYKWREYKLHYPDVPNRSAPFDQDAWRRQLGAINADGLVYREQMEDAVQKRVACLTLPETLKVLGPPDWVAESKEFSTKAHPLHGTCVIAYALLPEGYLELAFSYLPDGKLEEVFKTVWGERA
jgi:hypothetical protein